MDNKELTGHLRTQESLGKDLNQLRIAWKQHLLLMSSTLFGVLISLQNISEHESLVRWSFALGVALLALGILLLAVGLYSHIDGISRLKKSHSEESKVALREHRSIGPVLVFERKIFVVCEKLAYISLLLSALFLTSYVLLLAI